MPITTLKNKNLSIKIDSYGAELQSFFDVKRNLECLWQANSKYWARHAPILFPIVGRLTNDKLKHQGQSYPMSQHGFARDSEFKLIKQDETSVQFSLSSNEKSLKQYPFKFELLVEYKLDSNRLITTYTIRNPDNICLPTSIGAHPAFNWPLQEEHSKTDYTIQFQNNESSPVRQLNQGLILKKRFSNPIKGNKLFLKDELFENDALIFDKIDSREICYSSGSDLSITMRFDDFPHLGIWTKPNSPFICLEPWQGYSSSVSFDGEFSNKDGILLIPVKSEVIKSFQIILDELNLNG